MKQQGMLGQKRTSQNVYLSVSLPPFSLGYLSSVLDIGILFLGRLTPGYYFLYGDVEIERIRQQLLRSEKQLHAGDGTFNL